MEILRAIQLYADTQQMRFLVAGGHAVACYGMSRQTGDIDFVVSLSEKEKWLQLLEKLRYTKLQDDNRFSRFKPDQLAAWPIDLMYVDQNTFEKMYAARENRDFGATIAPIVSAKHLAILKLHALKHFQPHRAPKDYGDLLALIKAGAATFEDGELKALCIKYANQALYDRIISDIGRK